MSNGNPDEHSPRRLRFDDLASTLVRSPEPSGPPSPGHSGRRFVLAACATILAFWGILYLVFRNWRSRYRARADFGATRVAPTIDPLAEILPPGVDPRAWKEAVRETHAMLVSVTGANLLDVPQMESLRGELGQVVSRARSRPDQALRELAWVWDAMAERAAFVLEEGTSGRKKGHPRPAILPPPPERAARVRLERQAGSSPASSRPDPSGE
jgi:hypothetical protein